MISERLPHDCFATNSKVLASKQTPPSANLFLSPLSARLHLNAHKNHQKIHPLQNDIHNFASRNL